MEYKFLFLLLTFILINANALLAVGFSPASLIFELKPGQEDCKMITIDSDSETINVTDSWAENKDVEWKVNLFNDTASEHGISIGYDNNLSVDEREVQVCLSGSQLGEHHGVLIFKQEQEGNSIVQFGVWIKAVIDENRGTSSGSSSSSSSGGSGSSVSKGTSNTSNDSEVDFELLSNNANEEPQEDYNSGLTGRVVDSLNGKTLTVAGVALLLIVGAFILYNKRQERLRMEGKII